MNREGDFEGRGRSIQCIEHQAGLIDTGRVSVTKTGLRADIERAAEAPMLDDRLLTSSPYENIKAVHFPFAE